LGAEPLEARHLLATFIVTDLGDAPDADPNDGICDIDTNTPELEVTLAAAAQCVAQDGSGTIVFAIDGAFSPQSFGVPVTINGNAHLVEIGGTGLTLTAGGSVTNLKLTGKLAVSGSMAMVKNNEVTGAVTLNVSHATIDNNLFTASDDAGVTLTGDDNQFTNNRVINAALDGLRIVGSRNLVQTNQIGTDGAADFGNALAGIHILGASTVAADNRLIGNLISGNNADGVLIEGEFASGNKVEGNSIGTNAAGTAAIGNSGAGVRIFNAPSNTIGGDVAAERNLISGNLVGVLIESGSTDEALANLIEGNLIGTNAAGAGALANASHGIEIRSANTRGDTTVRANIISGNSGWGMLIASSGVKAFGNRIGLNSAGTAALGNGMGGIRIQTGSGDDGSYNTLGGPSQGNTISGNNGSGVAITGDGTAHDNVLSANLIGVNAAGTAALPNTLGISIFGTANTVGGTVASSGNVISGNTGHGVVISGSTSSANKLYSNNIGLNISSSAKLGNGGAGVFLDGASDNRLGDLETNTGNAIAGNGSHGVLISSGATNNLLARNTIGTNSNTSAGLGNTGDGVHLVDSPHNLIGQATVPNIISGNAGAGVYITGTASTANEIRGNLIGLGNNSVVRANAQGGITLTGDSSQTIIGGINANELNVISGNDQWGIALNDSHHNRVIGNYIGPNIAGTGSVSTTQQLAGVLIENGAHDNVIGVDAPVAASRFNVISANGGSGVEVRGANTIDNHIAGNVIGLAVGLSNSLANRDYGVLIHDGAHHNQVGGTLPEELNVIAANLDSNVALLNLAHDNTVLQNAIGYNPLNSATYGGQHGVLIDNAQDNLIGDPTGADGNIIRGNPQAGVRVQNGALGNRILGNSLFSNSGLGISLDTDLANLGQRVVLRQVTRTNLAVHANAQVLGKPNTTVRVDFYGSQSRDPSGFGEGQIPLLSGTVNIPAAGVLLFNVDLTLPDGTPPYEFITATLTDADNTTYEFSRAASPTSIVTAVETLTTSTPTNDVQPITLTAHVIAASGAPSGQVEFFDGNTLLGTANIGSGSDAKLIVNLTQGAHTLTAYYRGSSSHAAAIINTPLMVNVVVGPANVPPVAHNDTATVLEDSFVVINVLGNDVDPDGGTILPSTVVITQQPARGAVSVDPITGAVTYTPQVNYDGPDSFRYTVKDNRDGVSNAALVSITVTDIPEPWHNKQHPLDIDNDGVLTATDAVLITNLINARGSGAFPAPTANEPPPYYDTDGDNFLTPTDAVLVINAINAGASINGEGEPLEAVETSAVLPPTPNPLSAAGPVRSASHPPAPPGTPGADAAARDAFWSMFATLSETSTTPRELPAANHALADWSWLRRQTTDGAAQEWAERLPNIFAGEEATDSD
jgi:hypothetical protein